MNANDSYNREEERVRIPRWKRHGVRGAIELCVAVATGLVAVVCTYFSKSLNSAKFDTGEALLTDESSSGASGGFAVSFMFVWGINVAFSFVAAMFVVLVDPHTRGSGVPEIKVIKCPTSGSGVLKSLFPLVKHYHSVVPKQRRLLI